MGVVTMVALLFTACEDYLTLLPTDSIPEENFWESKGDVNNVRAAAYSQMRTSGVTDRILYWGEFRSDNLELRKMSNNSVRYLMNGVLQPTQGMFDWSSFYSGINYCNKVLENGQRMIDNNVDPTFSQGEWRPIKAEMLSLRALFYFYLVRAYRDVPYVDKTISTDTEALKARQGVKAECGANILYQLIQQLDECKEYAAKNYGNSNDNKGRFTKRSVRALMADMCLWEAALLKNGTAKGYYIVENGDTVRTQARFNELSNQYLQKSIDLCDYVIDEMDSVYRAKIKDDKSVSDEERNQPYPFYRISKAKRQTDDNVYQKIWGQKNSDENVFELQYSTTNTNSTISGMYYNNEDADAPVMRAKSSLISSISSVDNDGSMKGYGKTDLRAVETVKYESLTQSEFLVVKNTLRNLQVDNVEDLSQTKNVSYGDFRTSSSHDGNWPIYRLSDLMLIKAEAIARLYPTQKNTKELIEGFQLANKLFERYNPGLDSTTKEGAINTSTRLDFNYYVDKSGNNLLELVYKERQREFLSEGKRWFDLVRQAEYVNDTEDVLNSWMGATKEVKARLRKLEAMYVPYYNDELKANPALVQNPVWDRYTPNSSKPVDNK